MIQSILHPVTHLITIIVLWRYYCYPHSTGKKTEPQQDQIPCSRSQLESGSNLHPGSLIAECVCLSTRQKGGWQSCCHLPLDFGCYFLRWEARGSDTQHASVFSNELRMIRVTQINKQDIWLLTAEICLSIGEGPSIECNVGFFTQEPRMIHVGMPKGPSGGYVFIVALLWSVYTMVILYWCVLGNDRYTFCKQAF